MSLQDTKDNIEAYVITPWKHYRQLAASFNQTHNDCIKNTANALQQLFTGTSDQDAMQGAGADALATYFFNYGMAARKLTGYDNTFLCTRLDEGARISEKHAKALEDQLANIRVIQENGGGAIALGAGIAAAGAFDPVADAIGIVVAIGGTIAEAQANAKADAAAAQQAIADEEAVIGQWQTDVQTNANTTRVPELPNEPGDPNQTGPNKFATFFKVVLGLTAITLAGGAIGYAVYSAFPVDPNKTIQQLSANERALLIKYLSQIYGCTPAQIQAIMNKLGYQNLTAAQLERILKVLKIRAQLQTLLNKAQNAGLDTTALQKEINGDINAIDKGIRTGQAANWDDANVEGWENNLSGYAYMFDAAISQNATQIETNGADFISKDGTYFEVKNVDNIKDGDATYIKMRDQLISYASKGARAVGVVVPPDADPNLLKYLIEDLAKKGIYNVKVIRRPYIPPGISGNNWCNLS